MSLSQQEGPGVCVRFGLAYERLQYEDEARRRYLCQRCGIDPDRATPRRTLLISSQGPQVQLRRSPRR